MFGLWFAPSDSSSPASLDQGWPPVGTNERQWRCGGSEADLAEVETGKTQFDTVVRSGIRSYVVDGWATLAGVIAALLVCSGCGLVEEDVDGPPEPEEDESTTFEPSDFPDDPVAEIPSEYSGSRLKIRVENQGEGWYIRDRIFDTELGLDCSFRPVAGGRYRCVPDGSWPIAWADAECSEPVVIDAPDDAARAPGDWVVREDSHWCADEKAFSYFRIDEVLSEPPAEVYWLRDGACEPDDSRPTEGEVYYGLLPADPPSLVEGALVREDAQALSRGFIEGADGSRSFYGTFDVQASTRCGFSLETPNLVSPCLGYDAVGANTNIFGDRECREEGLLSAFPECPEPRIAYQAGNTGGPIWWLDGPVDFTWRFFRLGEPRTVSEVSTLVGYENAVCEVVPVPVSEALFWPVAEEWADPGIPFTRPAAFGSDRVYLLDSTNDEGARLFSRESELVDGDRGQWCVPQQLCNGSWVCTLVGRAFHPWHWADPACTQPLTSAADGVVTADGSCDGRRGLFDVDPEPYTGPGYAKDVLDDGTVTCVPTDLGDVQYTLYRATPTTTHDFALIQGEGFLPERPVP